MKAYIVIGFSLIFGTLAQAAAMPITNFQEVVPGHIDRGSRPDANGVAALKKSGVKTVIDLQGGDVIWDLSFEPGETTEQIAAEQNLVLSDHMNFISIPMSSLNPDEDDNNESINKALLTISDPKNQPVYFHCLHGKDRTGLLAALYRVFYQGCTPAQAHHEMMQMGHSLDLIWIDYYFYQRVKRDPRTHADTPAPTCPLN